MAFSGSVISIVLVASLTIFITVMSWVILKNGERLDDAQFKQRFGSITEDLNLKTNVGRLWNVIMLSKWALLGIILVFLRDYP